MMFSKWKKRFILILWIFLLPFLSIPIYAKEESLPNGDILVIYSDGTSNEDFTSVLEIVEYLTYQRFQVTYAPASSCLNQLNKFNWILCYKVNRYPKELINELEEREKKGNSILQARKGDKMSSGENDIRLLFVGNELLHTYLNETGRENSYTYFSSQNGKLKYYFNDLEYKEALVREDDFLFLTDDLDYQAGILEVENMSGYFCKKVNSLYHIPTTDLSNDLVKAAFIKEVAQWKWIYNGEPHTYAQYMVLNKVYPFQDSEKLLEVVKYMISRQEPFVISVMPIYKNGNYPAMQRFCEILRFAQANGGTIIIHSPINQMPDFDKEVVTEYLTSAIRIYMEQGVYPMGIQVPKNWMFNQDTIDVMSHFKTVLVSDEEDSLIKIDEDSNTNVVYKDGHQWIAPTIVLDDTFVSYLKTNSFAVYLDITKDMDILTKKINACIESFVPLKSLWDTEHSFWTNEDIMSYKNQIILINGKRVERDFVATSYEENFDYKRNTLQRYSKDLTKVNKKLVVVVLFTSFLFLIFIFMARHRNKKAFFINKNQSIHFESKYLDEKKDDKLEKEKGKQIDNDNEK